MNSGRIIPKQLFEDFKKKNGKSEPSALYILETLHTFANLRYTKELLAQNRNKTKPSIKIKKVQCAFGKHINNNQPHPGYSIETIELIIDYTYTVDIEKEDIIKGINFYRNRHGKQCEEYDFLLKFLQDYLNKKVITTKKTQSNKENKTTGKSKAENLLSKLFYDSKSEDSFDREHYITKALILINQYPVLYVDGLKGIGKTSFAKSLQNTVLKRKLYKSVFWKDITEGSTLDIFIREIEEHISLDGYGYNLKAKAKYFIRYLQTNDVLLILQYYDTSEDTSLLDFFEEIENPNDIARIILIQNSGVSPSSKIPEQTISIKCYNKEETSARLFKNNIILDEVLLEKLLKKTDGLPFYIDIFIKLYKSASGEQHRLIDDLLLSINAQNWLSRFLKGFSVNERNLLQILSLYNLPFDINTVIDLGNRIGILRADLLFDKIKDVIYLRKVGDNSWFVPPYISEHYLSTLRPEYENISGEYIISTIKHYKGKNYTILELQHICKAIKHFQRARNFKMSSRYFSNNAKILKRFVLYHSILDITKNEIELNSYKNGWMHWHYAHACYITGQFTESYNHILLCVDIALEKESNYIRAQDKVSFTIKTFQLYSDIINIFLSYQDALAIFAKALTIFDLSSFDISLRSQALSTLSWLYIKSGYIDIGIEINESSLSAQEILLDTNVAVAKTRIGVAYTYLQKTKKAEKYLSDAIKLFKKIPDYRALAWASLYYSKCMFIAKQDKEAMESLKICLEINNDNRLYDSDYRNELSFIKKTFRIKDKYISELLKSELNRIEIKEKDLKQLEPKGLLISNHANIIEKLNLKSEYTFNYKALIQPIEHKNIKMNSLLSISTAKEVARNPLPYLERLFKDNASKIFAVKQYNKNISRALENITYSDFILKKYLVPNLEIIINLIDYRSSVKLLYASSLEYAGAYQDSIRLLNNIPEKHRKFDYFNTLANCYRNVNKYMLSRENYEMALTHIYNRKNKGKVLNNIASLIYEYKIETEYEHAKKKCKEAIEARSSDSKFLIHPIKTLILLEIESIPLDDVDNVTSLFKSLISKYEVTKKKDVLSIGNEIKNSIKKKKIKSYLMERYPLGV